MTSLICTILLDSFWGNIWVEIVATVIIYVLIAITTFAFAGVNLTWLDVTLFPVRLFPAFFFPSRLYYDNKYKGELIVFKKGKFFTPLHQGLFILQNGIFKHIPDDETMFLLGYNRDGVREIRPNYFTRFNIVPIPSLKLADAYAYREGPEEVEYFIWIGRELRPVDDLYTYNRLRAVNKNFANRNFKFIPIGKKSLNGISRIKLSPAIPVIPGLNIQHMAQQFDRNVSTWLDKRYMNGDNNMHVPGQIKGWLDEQLFVMDKRLKLSRVMEDQRVIANEVVGLCARVVNEDGISEEGIKIIYDIQNFLVYDYANMFDSFRRIFYEYEWEEPDLKLQDQLRSLIDLLKNLNLPPDSNKKQFFFRYKQIINRLEKLDELNLKEFYNRIRPAHLLLIGKAYIGKTHGLADYTNRRLAIDQPSILIQAKAALSDSWTIIIYNGLQMLKDMSEQDLLSALQNVADQLDLNRKIYDTGNRIVNAPTQVLICADALDETANKAAWADRIRSLQHFTPSIPNVKFAFTARPSFRQYYLPDEPSCLRVVYIHGKSDADFEELKQALFKEYEIDVKYSNWLDYYIDTPLSLRLFCEQHRGITIEEQTDVSVNLPALIQRKIETLNTEISEKIEVPIEDNFIGRMLKALADAYTQDESFDENQIHEVLETSDFTRPYYDKRKVNDALRELCNSEVIIKINIDDNEPPQFKINETSVLEYMVADLFFDRIDAATFPHVLYEQEGALDMLAQLLYLRNRQFIGENGLWMQVPASIRDELKFKVLSKADPTHVTANDIQFIRNILFSR